MMHVPAGVDRSGSQPKMFGLAPLNIKLTATDSDGGFLVGEVIGAEGFGPPRHLHYEQDEWFYVVEGKFVIEVGGEQFLAGVGESIFAPRNVPHAWASNPDAPSKMIFVLSPAGPFQGFVDESVGLGRLPTPDEANKLFESYGMKITGPSLEVAKTSFEGA